MYVEMTSTIDHYYNLNADLLDVTATTTTRTMMATVAAIRSSLISSKARTSNVYLVLHIANKLRNFFIGLDYDGQYGYLATMLSPR